MLFRARLLVLFLALLLLAGHAAIGQQPAAPKPDFTLTAKALAEEFKNDNANAIVKYRGKVVEVTGFIKNAGLDKSDAPFLYLDGVPGALGGVPCVTTDKTPWKKAMPGQTVTVRGTVPEFATLARLADCEIKDIKGMAPVTMTATKFAVEYRANPAATDKKNERKWVIILGEVASVAAIDVGEEAKAALVTFKTDGKPPTVVARFLGNDNKMTAGLEAGTKIKVLGSYGPTSKDEIGIGSGLMLDFK
jgi:hypothetical protein